MVTKRGTKSSSKASSNHIHKLKKVKKTSQKVKKIKSTTKSSTNRKSKKIIKKSKKLNSKSQDKNRRKVDHKTNHSNIESNNSNKKAHKKNLPIHRKTSYKYTSIKDIKRGKLEEQLHIPPHEMYEEYVVPSPIHRGKYHIPAGIKFLIGYLTFLTVLYLVSFFSGITFPTSILFGKLITGPRAMFINIILVAIILFLIYGFYKRKAYSFNLSIGFFVFAAINAFISFVLFESSEHPIFKKMLLLSFVSLIVMDIVIIWYIRHERKYFFEEQFRQRPWHHRDKVFLYCIITFWAVTLMLGLTWGVQFYNDTTEMIDDTLVEFNGHYYYSPQICEIKEGTESDVCYLVSAIIHDEMNEIDKAKSLCMNIDSEFYRFTCKRSILDEQNNDKIDISKENIVCNKGNLKIQGGDFPEK